MTSGEVVLVGGPRRWAPARVVRTLQAEAGLPEGGTIERVGPMTCLAYRDNGLLRRLALSPAVSPGRLRWQAEVCDDVVRSATTGLWTCYKKTPVFPAVTETSSPTRLRSRSQTESAKTGFPEANWPLAIRLTRHSSSTSQAYAKRMLQAPHHHALSACRHRITWSVRSSRMFWRIMEPFRVGNRRVSGLRGASQAGTLRDHCAAHGLLPLITPDAGKPAANPPFAPHRIPASPGPQG
jgi:hypothetical protein